MFINRKRELKMLQKIYNTEHAELFVLYGRRRVGKTELIKEFIKDKKNIYFMSDLTTEKELLKMFTERAMNTLAKDENDISFSSWDGVFKFIANHAKAEKIIVVLDEFQYVCTSNNAFSSILQRLWDEYLKDTKIKLILCGSYISFMENEVLAIKSPLYGRRTAQYMLQAMSFFDIHDFYPKYNIVKLITVFSILGGIPAYLNKFKDNFTIEYNIQENIISPETFLQNEVQFLLMQELKETRNYFAILQQIAFGETKLNDIVAKSGLEKGLVSKYLYTLQELRIVKREIPITEKNPIKSKKGLYKILDQYTKFWFKFVFPNKSLVEENGEEFVLNAKVLPHLSEFVSWTFEDVCVDYLKKMNAKNMMPFVFEKIGRWWDNNEEVDVLAIGEENVILGECKWNENRKINVGVLKTLQAKGINISEISEKEKYYFLFSRAGFTDELEELAKSKSNVFLIGIEDFENAF